MTARRRIQFVIAWTLVGLPLAWGVWVTLAQALVLFSGGS